MTYTIKNDCNACGGCQSECPNGAIKSEDTSEGYWIDPTLCDGCKDVEIPRCLEACNVGSLKPLPSKKGRYKTTPFPTTILDIFLNRKTTPFASSMVMWETCNILAQRQTLPWQTDSDGYFAYSRPVRRDKGEMRFRLAADPEAEVLLPMNADMATAAIANFDIRATCIHLILAAYAVSVECPWEEVFVLNNQHIEKYLGLDKRKDLTKLEKLTLIKDLVHQSCRILVALDWPRQGKVQSFTLEEHPVWHLLATQYHFEEDTQGCRHLIGLDFTIRAGTWVKYFLNKQEYRRQTAFYQYGVLPRSLLAEIMSNWQQHEGAIRLLLWLLFKMRLGGDQRMKVLTLLHIAYGEERVTEAIAVRGSHKRTIKTFESDLETIYHYGLKPLFDPETYPSDIQPLWTKVADIPNDPDDALEFWSEDANQVLSLTDTAPRDKWQRLLNARLLGFELPEEWQQTIRRRTPKRRYQSPHSKGVKQSEQLSGREINTARRQQNLTQRALASRLGKSQSWVRDIEKERFKINADDQVLLRKVLNIN
ncbi:helix-turn-helix domain-containing protein [Geitlerinema sp. CS-897]|nr:helix-turn-helix domain-containing protein [Geitlerinema sp. CS-897]